MAPYIYVILVVIGGILGGIQAPINGALGKRIGGFEASFLSFLIGALFLFFIVLFFGKGNLLQTFSVPKWQLIGGILGSIFVTMIILAVPNIGAASTIFAAILGQIIISVAIDHFGFFGVERIQIDWQRFTGIVLMIVGLYFIFRGNLTS
jgi:transporter family-2 protein